MWQRSYAACTSTGSRCSWSRRQLEQFDCSDLPHSNSVPQTESLHSAKATMTSRSATAHSITQFAPNCSSAYVVVVNGQTQGAQHVQQRRVAAAIHGVFEHTAWDTEGQQQPAIAITSILQNEAPHGLHKYGACPADAEIDGPNSFSLRAENGRIYSPSQGHQGRMYFIKFTARNGVGSCEGYATACVPEIGATDCRPGDDEPLYDSMSCESWPLKRINVLNWAA